MILWHSTASFIPAFLILVLFTTSCTNVSYNQLDGNVDINITANLNAEITVGDKISGTGSETVILWLFRLPGKRFKAEGGVVAYSSESPAGINIPILSSLFNTIKKMINTPFEKREKMSLKSRRLIEKQFDVKIVNKRIVNEISKLNNEKREGSYHCVNCGVKLFDSKTKYESGSGWPSFFKSLPDVFETKTDHLLGYARTEYHCKTCGGHHGHIFDDGPKPTGKRYCNNGICLIFKGKI